MELMTAYLLSAEYRKSVGLHQPIKHRRETFALRNLFVSMLFLSIYISSHERTFRKSSTLEYSLGQLGYSVVGRTAQVLTTDF